MISKPQSCNAESFMEMLKSRMTDAEHTAERLLEILKQLAIELHPQTRGAIPVTLDSLLDRDLGLDSLGRMELLQRIECAFEISLSEWVLSTAQTPRDLLRVVLAASTGGTRQPLSTEVRNLAPGEAEGVPSQARSLLEVLEWHVHAHPNRPHISLYRESGQEEEITYAALQQGAEAVAVGLRKQDLQPGEAVALMLPTSRDYFYGFYGILLAGGVPVPLYPPARPSQIEEHLRRHAAILSNALVSILIAFPEAQRYTRLLKTQVKGLRTIGTVQELSAAGGTLARHVVQAQDVALLQYTSGSTGHPKGVVLTHANLLANIRAMGQVVQADFTDVFVSWLPLYHDMGLIAAWLGSLYHASLFVIMSPLTFLARPERWLWAIHTHRGTLSAAPNFAYELCLRKIDDNEIKDLDLSSWRMAFNGAEPVSPETILRFTQRFGKYGFRPEAMAPVYGLAECSVGLAFPSPGRRPMIDRINRQSFLRTGYAMPAKDDDPSVLRFVACGQPLPGHQIRIVDATGHEVGERQEGRLEFMGPSTTSGYFRNANETRRLFHGEWLDSGDQGYMVGGDAFITGRVKDMIIRAGQNIYPHELEEAIDTIPGIRKGCVAVFGSTDPVSQTERLVVVAETRETDAGVHDKLHNQINTVTMDLLGLLADDVVLAPPYTIPKTSSGKIRRAASRELYEHRKIGRRLRAVQWQYARLAIVGALSQLRRSMHTIATILYAAYGWALFSVLAPVAWASVALLPRPSWRRSVLRSLARIILRLSGTPLVVRGLEQLPSEGPYVLVTNHASYLDNLVLTAALPSHVCFVAKRELTERFLTRVFLRRIGAQFVERFDLQRGVADARQLTQAVRQGQLLVIYPEGTLTRVPGLLPFHMGAFVIAAEAGVPVVPVTIRGTRTILRDGQWFPRRGWVHIAIGTPLMPEGSDWSAAVKLREAARAVILRHCGEPDLADHTHTHPV